MMMKSEGNSYLDRPARTEAQAVSDQLSARNLPLRDRQEQLMLIRRGLEMKLDVYTLVAEGQRCTRQHAKLAVLRACYRLTDGVRVH